MRTRLIEIRDEGTCIPAIAMQMWASNAVEAAFYRRCGYPQDRPYSIILMELNYQRATSDPYEWGGRTNPVVHDWLIENFDTVCEGQVIDVRVLLKEHLTPVDPEIFRSTSNV